MSAALLAPPAERALEVLSPRRRAFVLAFIASGNASNAASAANYRDPASEGARLLRDPKVKEAIAALRSVGDSDRVLRVADLRAWWSDVVRDSQQPIEIRLKAAETLARSLGAFIERHEVLVAPRPEAAVIEYLRRLDEE